MLKASRTLARVIYQILKTSCFVEAHTPLSRRLQLHQSQTRSKVSCIPVGRNVRAVDLPDAMDFLTILTYVGIPLAVTALFGCYYLVRSGCLHTVKIWVGRPEFYELQIAYKTYKGDYMKSGEPFGLITKLLPDLPCINAYYDDPKKVPAEECRYICGVVLSEGLEESPDLDTIRRANDYGFKIHTFPRVDKVMKSSFPFTTSISPTIAAMKVYPRLAKYVKENHINATPYLEICKDGIIHYMCILDRHDEFVIKEHE